MASSHSRNASTTDRRNVNAAGIMPRAASVRAREYEKAFVRDDGSPATVENSANPGHADRPFEKSNRQTSDFERRTERTFTTTKEKMIRTRSPAKEMATAGNKREPDRVKRHVQSPVEKKKAREIEPGRLPVQKVTQNVLTAVGPWTPSAKLIAHSSAPLAPRISAPPLSSTAPVALHPPPLSDMSMPEQEAALLDDLLYVFMGYEGQYVRFVDAYNPGDEKARLVGPDFQIASGLDPSLHDLTTSMLKMATHYCAMEAFVEVQSREEFGSVNHALCAAIRNLLKDYLILVAQLEMKVIHDESFTLPQMHLHVIPPAQSLAHLYALAQELSKKNALLEDDLEDSIDDFDPDNIIERLREGGDLLPGSMMKKRCTGGNVLATLTQRLAVFSGDPAARTLLELLLREASRPYVTMLNEWLHRGGIKDPHSEFLIGERSGIRRERMDEDYTDEYWEKRYYVRETEVPPQLASVKEKVLLAGKYLNVVRECGGVNISNKIEDTPNTFDDPKFLDNVSNAYSHANAALLNLLLTKNSLRSRLRSLKHYFFLDRAEFFLYFLELSSSELKKPHKSVNTGKLQSLLDLVLRQPGSIAAADPFKEDVKVKMNEIGLTQWLMKIVNVQGMDQDNPDAMLEKYQTPAPSVTNEDGKEINGFDALELDYAVPFPLSLVISRKTVLRYQLLFRYTLALRHLESLLVDCWSEHTKVPSWTHKSSNPRIEVWKRRAWTLRARMLVFVQQMLFFATAEVIEPNWQKLIVKVDESESVENQLPPTLHSGKPIKTKRTVDELMQDHLDMLDSCMKDLGLTQGKLLKIHAKLMTGCTLFAQYTASLSRSLYAADPDLASGSDQPGKDSSSNTRPGSTDADPDRLVKMDVTLKRYEEYFSKHLKILIDSLNYFAATETVVLLGLCARLTAAEERDRDSLL